MNDHNLVTRQVAILVSLLSFFKLKYEYEERYTRKITN